MEWCHDRKGDTLWADDKARNGTWWIVPQNGDSLARPDKGDPVTHYKVSLALPWENVRDPHTKAATWHRAVTRTSDEAILLIESGDIDLIAERVLIWDYNCLPGCCDGK